MCFVTSGTRLAIIAALTICIGPLAATAATQTWTSDNTCSVSDLTPNAALCFGTLSPDPKNDNKVDFNGDTFIDGVSTTGLFGLTDWNELGKDETPGGTDAGGTALGLDATPDNGATSGSWTMTSGILAAYSQVVIVLKGGPDFAAYLFNDPASAESGGFTMPQKAALSHLSVYGRTGGGVDDNPPPVPLPAGLPLILSALGLVALLRHRGRST